MKTIGLIGGTGWASSAEYYRLINEKINERLGGREYAHCILYSLNYGDIQRLKINYGEEGVLAMLIKTAWNLINSGAEGLALCANTMHLYAEKLQQQIDVPLIHIGTATALTVKKGRVLKVGLLGTKITMEGSFYKDNLKKHGIETIVPSLNDRNYINSIIFDELFHLKFKKETRKRILEIIDVLINNGAEGIILGCTEIPLLIQQKHTDIPLFDTLDIHSTAIVDFALT
ncbi:MAG: amino acid racemase [Chlorobi bacterium]|nr:amino acid racemase [Chlorobiota bacterium]